MTRVPIIAAVVIFAAMLFEARLSSAHERWLRARSAVEPPDDVYPLMRIAYPVAFVAMIAEAWMRRVTADSVFAGGVVIFAAAKALKYWAMATLGSRWTFRVLVPPESTLVTSGPYRWLHHPNYVGVAGELIGTAIAMRAFITGPVAVIAFVAILWARVRVEERALSR